MTELRLPRHGRNHLLGGSDPIPGVITSAPVSTFFDAVMALAVTNDLRGYWRLGDGGLGPYADSKPAGSWANTPMARINNTVDMSDIDPGALAAGDDGAVQFNQATGAITSDYLEAPNVWGTGTSNPFQASLAAALTVVGWVKPVVSASTFDGGIFSMLADASGNNGYAVGVAWPARNVFFHTYTTRLTGPVLTAGSWVFVCAVHDATSNRIYLNGALVATGTAAGPEPSTNISPLIGLWNHSSGAGPGPGVLYGAVDEVAVWGTALTDTQIAALYVSGVSAGGGASGGTVVDSFSKLGAARLTGDVTVSAGSNVTLTQTGQNVQIAAVSLLWEDV